MLSTHEFQLAVNVFPFLLTAPEAHQREFMANAIAMRFPTDATVFEEGQVCGAMALLLEGAVRVFKIGESGRQITLYRFGRGEGCILTASCILSQRTFPAIATIEQAASAIVVPAGAFEEWISKETIWRDYVFRLLSSRLSGLMALVDQVAFNRMDQRIAELLLREATTGAPLKITHQEIASELGTSREVVSRILEDFQMRGAIMTQRGSLTVVRPELLRVNGA